MKGSKPRTPLTVITGTGKQRATHPYPGWLPAEGRTEWQRAVKDLSSRGLMFEGAQPLLENFVLCLCQIRQCQKVLAGVPIADSDGIHPAYHAQQKAIQSARLLGVELGLSTVSRLRSFQGKAADEREWDELEVG